jgi:hypothetical protein
MPGSVNVILNSNNKVSGTTQAATYFVDWRSILDPRKKYQLHFVYLGGLNTWSGAAGHLPMIYADFNTRNIQPLNGNSANSQCLGFLMPTMVQGASTTVYFQSLDNTNLPIYMEGPPGNNTFTIRILDNDAVQTPYLDTGASLPAEYILILHFHEAHDRSEEEHM